MSRYVFVRAVSYTEQSSAYERDEIPEILWPVIDGDQELNTISDRQEKALTSLLDMEDWQWIETESDQVFAFEEIE